MALIRVLSLSLFPGLLAAFAAVHAADPPAYRALLQEDGIVENATVLVLLAAAALSLACARRIPRGARRFRWFYVAVAAFCVLVAVEELSWGQRLFGFASPQFFREHARQRETNVHNVVEKVAKLPTRGYLALAALMYGVYLPLAVPRKPRLAAWAARIGVRIPPPFLAAGFALAALMQVDYPTGYEEEIGELFFGLCAALFMLKELADPAHARPGARDRSAESAPAP
jgi:hypothetical protein